jgi:uncharacterized protein (DUF362 family)
MAKHGSHSSLSRREFLRLAAALGGTTALASLLEGCSRASIDQEVLLSPTDTHEVPTLIQETATAVPPVLEGPKPTETETIPSLTPAETKTIPSVTPTETIDDGKTRLAFIKTNDRTEGVRKAIDLLGINPVAGKRIFLKPNFNSSDPAPGSTHPDVLIALVTALKEMGAQKITVGDRSGMGDTRKVMDQIGVFKLSEEMGFDTLVFDELTPEDWVMIQPSGTHWEKGIPFARPCLEADALVQACCLKTHRFGGHFTLSLKNSVGMVAKRYPGVDHDFMQELHSSSHQRRMIAEINAAYTPALIVLDGIEAFISGGPDVGERVVPEVILAGTDRIAIDAVGIALLRYFGCKTEAGKGKIFEQEQIARAVELGLGIDSPEKIEFLTGDADSAVYGDQIKEILLAG